MKRFARLTRLVRRGSVLVLALTILTGLGLQTAYAADSSSALSITPRKDYVLEPGKSLTDKLTIGNLNREVPLFIRLKVIDFSFMDETGTPKLLLAKDAPQTTWSLKPFVTLPSDVVEIPAGKTKTIEYKINIPANQGAGSYYSAIQYDSGGSDGGNVNLSASGVTLAFLSVPGTVKEDMQLQKFGAFQRDKPEAITGKYLKIAVGESPNIIAYTLKNNGNVAESPAGQINLKDTFGNQVANIQEANPNSNIALIGQARRFEACIAPQIKKVDENGKPGESVTCGKTKLKPGRYTASLDAFYGQNGNQTHELTAVATFWYLPVWFIVAVLIGLLLIAYFIWRIKRKLSNRGNKVRTAVSKKPFWKFWKR